ncbi:hypothetical protein [Serratia sp. 2723]|uniref:hypothetical protein n=1 Tax=unclassified Serratia (in: enterobacteria) TaxID=2647522 RepID=UPI003D20BED7
MPINIIIMNFLRRVVLFITGCSRFLGYCMALGTIYPAISLATMTSRLASTAATITVGATFSCTGEATMNPIPADIPAISSALFFAGTVSGSCDDPTAQVGIAFQKSSGSDRYGIDYPLGSAIAGKWGDSCKLTISTKNGTTGTQPSGAIWGSGTIFLPSGTGPNNLYFGCAYPGGTANLVPGTYSIPIAIGYWGTS